MDYQIKVLKKEEFILEAVKEKVQNLLKDGLGEMNGELLDFYGYVLLDCEEAVKFQINYMKSKEGEK